MLRHPTGVKSIPGAKGLRKPRSRKGASRDAATVRPAHRLIAPRSESKSNPTEEPDEDEDGNHGALSSEICGHSLLNSRKQRSVVGFRETNDPRSSIGQSNVDAFEMYPSELPKDLLTPTYNERTFYIH